jgi:hypothetical protein
MSENRKLTTLPAADAVGPDTVLYGVQAPASAPSSRKVTVAQLGAAIPINGGNWSGAALAVANGGTGATDAGGARTNLGLGNVENKNSASIRSELTGANVTTALAYTPTSVTGLTGIQTVAGLGAVLPVSTAQQSALDLKANIASPTFTGPVTLAADPVSGLQAATKQYVDSVAQGLDAKVSVRAATTANITLSGAQTIDGVALTAGERALVKNQSSAAANGIYVVAAGGWTRAPDMDAWSEVPGAFVFVEEGAINADTGWVCTSNSGGAVGANTISWAQFSGAGSYSAGAGLTLSGTQFAVDTAVVAQKSGGLSQFASTTSAQLAAVLSDETGTGAAVFSNGPSFTVPVLGAATATTLVASGAVTSGSGFRATGNNFAGSTGAGAEVAYVANAAYFNGYNYLTSTYADTNIGAPSQLIVKGATGRVLINTGIDDGVNRLQVAGGAAFAAGVTASTLALGGGTIGSNVFAAVGNTQVTSALNTRASVETSDGAATAILQAANSASESYFYGFSNGTTGSCGGVWPVGSAGVSSYGNSLLAIHARDAKPVVIYTNSSEVARFLSGGGMTLSGGFAGTGNFSANGALLTGAAGSWTAAVGSSLWVNATGATGNNVLVVGYNAGLSAGSSVDIWGSTTNGGAVNISTNYMGPADAPLYISTWNQRANPNLKLNVGGTVDLRQTTITSAGGVNTLSVVSTGTVLDMAFKNTVDPSAFITLSNSGGYGLWQIGTNGANRVQFNNVALALNNLNLTFQNSVTSADVGIARDSVGVIQINNGTVNSYADLTLRNIVGTGAMRPGSFTVATLPSSPTAGDEVTVTDATSATNGSVAAGGGSNNVKVRRNGTAWKVIG